MRRILQYPHSPRPDHSAYLRSEARATSGPLSPPLVLRGRVRVGVARGQHGIEFDCGPSNSPPLTPPCGSVARVPTSPTPSAKAPSAPAPNTHTPAPAYPSPAG